jgi:hypothetical protein
MFLKLKVQILPLSPGEKIGKKLKIELIMPVTSECSTVAENLSRDPNIGGSNQATGTRKKIIANRVNYGQGQG